MKLLEGWLFKVAVRKAAVAAAEGTLVTGLISVILPKIQPYITQFWTTWWPAAQHFLAEYGVTVALSVQVDTHKLSLALGGVISLVLLRLTHDAAGVAASNLKQDEPKPTEEPKQ